MQKQLYNDYIQTQLTKYKSSNRGEFQFLLILDLLGISFHAVVVFALGKNLLFKFLLGHCVGEPGFPFDFFLLIKNLAFWRK